MQKILDNLVVFQEKELWDGTLEGRVDSEVRCKIGDIQTKMQSLNFFFKIQLEYTIQTIYLILYNTHTCHVIELSKLKKVCFSMLQGMREETSFRSFFEKASARKLDINGPKQLIMRRATARFFIKQFIWLSTVFVICISRKITQKLFRQKKYCF